MKTISFFLTVKFYNNVNQNMLVVTKIFVRSFFLKIKQKHLKTKLT